MADENVCGLPNPSSALTALLALNSQVIAYCADFYSSNRLLCFYFQTDGNKPASALFEFLRVDAISCFNFGLFEVAFRKWRELL